VAILVEAKNQKLSMAKTVKELDDGLANWEANVAVAVFRSPDDAPTNVPFSFWGNRGIAVVDDFDPIGLRVLELAYMWARWIACKSIAQDGVGDASVVSDAVKDIAQALARATTMRRCHSKARNGLQEAGGQLDDMVAEIEAATGRLRGWLN